MFKFIKNILTDQNGNESSKRVIVFLAMIQNNRTTLITHINTIYYENIENFITNASTAGLI